MLGDTRQTTEAQKQRRHKSLKYTKIKTQKFQLSKASALLWAKRQDIYEQEWLSHHRANKK